VPSLLLIAVYRQDWTLGAEYVERIRRAAGSHFEVAQARTDADFERLLPGAEVLFGWHLAPENLPRAAKLKWVQVGSAGIDWALFPEFVRSGVVLTSAVGIHAVQMSEHALAMMLALTRKLPHFVRRQAGRNWDRPAGDDMGELSGKTLGVFGLGAIGEALAVRAKAFGMRVLGVKNSPSGYRGAADEAVGPDAMKRVLGESDYVVNLLPLTKATRGIVSAAMIAAMKPTAFFVNLGRGATVDEKALVAALRAGKIRGAGLDVFEEEPLAENSPLWEMENVIITPHVGGLTPRYWERATDLFCRNLARYIAGEELVNVVDKEIGY